MSIPDQTIRVANIIEEARWGGPQSFIVNVAAGLRDHDIETLIVMPEKENWLFVEKLRALGLDYRALKLHRLTRNKRGLLSFLIHFLGDITRIRKVVRDSGADIVHCHSSTQWKGVIAATIEGTPVIWTLHDTNSPKLVRSVFKFLARFAVGFIPVAERAWQYYLNDQLKAKPSFLIQAPVDCQSFDPTNVTAHIKTAQMADITIGCIGNVNPDKDMFTYVRMARQLRKKFGDRVRCFQVGGQFDSQKNYVASVKALNELDGDDVVLMQGVSTDVRPFLRAADIYVCSSRFEASPISVWEAMAMGLPIVATDVGDIARMNEDGDFARVVPTEDAAALANAVTELINAPDERKRLGANARKYALENLDIKICVRKHAAAYLAVLRQ